VAFSCNSTKANFEVEHVQLALFGPHLGDIDVEVTDRVTLELLLRRLVALNIGQATNAVALQAAVQ
jgi:hypothetical protein